MNEEWCDIWRAACVNYIVLDRIRMASWLVHGLLWVKIVFIYFVVILTIFLPFVHQKTAINVEKDCLLSLFSIRRIKLHIRQINRLLRFVYFALIDI